MLTKMMLAAAVIAASGPAAAVFKCTGPTGKVVYSDEPCGGQMQVIQTNQNTFERTPLEKLKAKPRPAETDLERQMREHEQRAHALSIQRAARSEEANQAWRNFLIRPQVGSGSSTPPGYVNYGRGAAPVGR
ncbi:DUF4124 domain-containing protein [Caenimonas sedimenti]|uniref:DUF4124 domain-containing protein n=1 Tax=Caenimonas sedimenti TaxID=2596921 RepID=A0A562ZHI3_9BURK|nr:DUF4124 domain-containing protein [Caenimonas sedimenti]TWO67768.1 DUF4124 domain-containing protein [Caenimonas sedimenti]